MGTSNQAQACWSVLFSSTRQRVLEILFAQPGRSLYLTELVRQVGRGTGSVQRELVRLEGAGLLLRQRVGNQVHFSANPDAPFYDEIRAMVSKVCGARPEARLKAAVQALSPAPRQVFWHPPQPGSGAGLLVVGASQSRDELMRDLAATSDAGLVLTLLRPERFDALLESRDPQLLALLRPPAVALVGNAVERLSLDNGPQV